MPGPATPLSAISFRLPHGPRPPAACGHQMEPGPNRPLNAANGYPARDLAGNSARCPMGEPLSRKNLYRTRPAP